jgi:hypothetical protein
MSRVTPLPFDVETFALNSWTPVPPLKVPPAPIAHAADVAVALKLPLLWADTVVAKEANANVNRNAAILNIGFFI